MNFASTNRKDSYIKPEDIAIKALTFDLFDIDNQTSVSLKLPFKTIYNELGYWVKHKHQIKEITDISFITLMSILLLVSVKDRKIQGDEAMWLESELAPYQPISHLYWIILELFKSVSRLVSRLEMNVPEIIKNEQKAWKDYFKRDSVSYLGLSSKSQYIKSIRRTAKVLRENKNPFNSESPEMKIFIDYALTLSDIGHSDKNKPKDIRTLRKHIRQRLKDLIQALTGYATYLERSSCQVLTNIDGRAWRRGIKNNMKMIQ